MKVWRRSLVTLRRSGRGRTPSPPPQARLSASAGSPLAWVKSAAGNSGRVGVPCERAAAAADGQRTWPCMGDRWVRGANNGRRHGAFFVLALLDTISGESPLAYEFSCKAAALVCVQHLGHKMFFCYIPIELSFCAPKLYVEGCERCVRRGGDFSEHDVVAHTR